MKPGDHLMARCTTCGDIFPRGLEYFPQHDKARKGECVACAHRKRDVQQCKWCGYTKSTVLFWRDKRRKSGRDSVCSDCRNQRRYETDGKYAPTLTKGLKKKPNGLYPMYWERD
jgi:hypothetical protein